MQPREEARLTTYSSVFSEYGIVPVAKINMQFSLATTTSFNLILLLPSSNSLMLQTLTRTSVGAARSRVNPQNLLLADLSVRDIVHGLEILPVPNLLVEELVQVQPAHLRLFADAQVHSGGVFQREEKNARDDERVSGDGGDFGKLLADLHSVAIDSAGSHCGAVEGADGLVGEDSRQERAHHAADAVQLEDVEPLVDFQPLVQVLQRGARDGCDEADHGCQPDRDVACGGRDAD